ncbi:MAG TPA: hypothetical protein VGO62_01780 [Myxococcota bacterium]|jgi:hypothetical protein
MKRRSFVTAAVAGAALWPALIQRSFACPPDAKCAAQAGVDVLAAAFQRAHLAHKPLLVLVIPGDEQKYERGQLLGTWLNHGTDAELAPLARVEVVCATPAALRALVPTANAIDDAALAAIVGTSALAPRVVAVRASLPPVVVADRNRSLQGLAGDEEQAIKARVQIVAAAMTSAIEGAAPTSGAAPVGEVASAARAVRSAIVEAPPAGARWAQDGGCAAQVEGEPKMLVGCGMGHVPEISRRFLWLFTKLPFAETLEQE